MSPSPSPKTRNASQPASGVSGGCSANTTASLAAPAQVADGSVPATGLTSTQPSYPDIERRVAECRFALRKGLPFFGHLLLNIPIRVTEEIPTAAVSNEERFGVLYVNPDFANQMTRQELSSVMVHEVLHLAMGVFGRMKGRNPMLWNIAHDYAINLMIEDTRTTNPKLGLAWPEKFPPLLDTKYTGMTAEDIYDQLLQELASEPKGGGGDGQGDPGSEDEGDPSDGEGSGSGSPMSQAGGRGYKPGAKPMAGDGKGFSDATDCIMVKKQSPEEASRQERALKNLLAEALQVQAASRAGTLPGSIAEMVDGMLRVQVPWATQLAHKVDGRLKGGGSSYARLSKRSAAVGMAMPGRGRRKPQVTVAIDTSGSVSSGEVKAFLAVIRQIMEAQDVAIRMIQLDADIQEDRLIEDFDEMLDHRGRFQVQGRGGTDFAPLIERLEGVDGPRADVAVLFTDGDPIHWPEVGEWPCHLVVVTTRTMPPDGYDAVKFDLPPSL